MNRHHLTVGQREMVIQTQSPVSCLHTVMLGLEMPLSQRVHPLCLEEWELNLVERVYFATTVTTKGMMDNSAQR